MTAHARRATMWPKYVLIVLLATVLALTTAAGSATAATWSATETLIGVPAPAAITAVGLPEHITAGQHSVRAGPHRQAPEDRSRPAGHCSAAGTRVVMADGITTPTGRMHIDDKVRAADSFTEAISDGTVVPTHRDSSLLDLTVRAAKGAAAVLHTTLGHPVWNDTTHTWITAGELLPGQRVHTPDDTTVEVAKTLSRTGDTGMWDLTVDTDHTYYVTPVGRGEKPNTSVLVHNAGGPACDLSGARQVSGRFPNEAGPGETLVRNDPVTGDPTHYQVYDESGLPVKRVDLTGKAHNGIPTPHVQEFDRNVNPATGQTFVNPGQVRPAEPWEIP